jgi:hypothetical protein
MTGLAQLPHEPSVMIPIFYNPVVVRGHSNKNQDDKENAVIQSSSSQSAMTVTTPTKTPATTTETMIPLPPEWALVELNGELLAPIELPDADSTRRILGQEGQMELGLVKLEGKVRCIGHPTNASTTLTCSVWGSG